MMLDRIRSLFRGKPSTETQPAAPAQAATGPGTGTQSGVAAAAGTADREPPEDEPDRSKGAV